jgi:hypothetical protein
MKQILNFIIILVLLLSVCCNRKQSSSNSGQQTARSNKQYSTDFAEAELQLNAGVGLFSALEFEYYMNWQALFFGRFPAADIEAGEKAMERGEGGTLSSELRQAIAFAHAENCHQTIGKYLGKITNPPMDYAPAYAKLIEAYGAYERLYDIVNRPRGSTRQAYEAASKEEERNFHSIYAQVEALTPKSPQSDVERQAAEEQQRAADQKQAEWFAKHEARMQEYRQSVRREGEARRELQAANDSLEELGHRDRAVAARNEASRKRVEEIMSGHAPGYEGFNGTREEAQLIADKERLRDLKNTIAARQEVQPVPTATATVATNRETSRGTPELSSSATAEAKTEGTARILRDIPIQIPGGTAVLPAGTTVHYSAVQNGYLRVHYANTTYWVPKEQTDFSR